MPLLVGVLCGSMSALTLGCGAVGGSSTSNNIGPIDLINIKRVAFGVKELSEIRKEAGMMSEVRMDNCKVTSQMIENIVEKVMRELAS